MKEREREVISELVKEIAEIPKIPHQVDSVGPPQFDASVNYGINKAVDKATRYA